MTIHKQFSMWNDILAENHIPWTNIYYTATTGMNDIGKS